MAKKRSMPPEIVDYFKKKGGKDVEKSDDNLIFYLNFS